LVDRLLRRRCQNNRHRRNTYSDIALRWRERAGFEVSKTRRRFHGAALIEVIYLMLYY